MIKYIVISLCHWVKIRLLQVKLDFANDVTQIFAEPQDLNCFSSGHYLIPLCDNDLDSKNFFKTNSVSQHLLVKWCCSHGFKN